MFLHNQYAYLRQLTQQERTLLLSYFAFNLAAPIFLTYSNTYLWRQFSDPLVIIFYNIGVYLGISFGFFLNTLGLRINSARVLYFNACVLQGVVPVLLVAITPQTSLGVFGLGCLFGLAAGIYWANRNYYTAHVTRGSHRFSFLSVEHALSTTASVLTPAIVGWFIALGGRTGIYDTSAAYQLATCVGLLLLIVSGLAASGIRTDERKQRLKKLFVQNASATWHRLRTMELYNGFVHGVEMIVPLLIIMTLVGLEEAVGTLQTVASLLAAVAMYFVGKHMRDKDHKYILSLWLSVLSLGGLLLAIFFTPASIVLYTVLAGFIGPFRWTSMATLMYGVVDKQPVSERSLYLFDREVMLNVGRILALITLGFTFAHAPDFTMRFGLLGVIVIRFLLVIATSQIQVTRRRIVKNAKPVPVT